MALKYRDSLLCVVVMCLVVSLSPSSPVVMADDGDQEIITMVMDELKSGDRERQTGAIALIRDIPGSGMTQALTEALPELSAPIQVMLISALSDRGDVEALPAVVKAIQIEDESVRIAAFKAVGALGNASSVSLLAQQAAQTRGQERKAARDSLYQLRGAEVDSAILEEMATAEPNVKAELVRAIGERNITSGIGTLLITAKDKDRKVRTESLKVLKTVAGPNDLPALVDLAMNLVAESDRNEAEKTVAAVAHKIEDSTKQAVPVLAVWLNVKDVKNQASLLRILGRIGDNTALSTLRTALASDQEDLRDAAIRALADWPTAEPLPDLLNIVQNSKDRVHRIVALRGYVRLIGVAETLSDAQAIEAYRKAMELAPNDIEKKRVLSGVSQAGTQAALKMATIYLEDADLQLEAESAVVRIADQIGTAHPELCKEALSKVIERTRNEAIRSQAQEVIKKLDGTESNDQ